MENKKNNKIFFFVISISILLIHQTFFQKFFPNSQEGLYGHDYEQFIPNLIFGKIWFHKNFLSIPWFTPALCCGMGSRQKNFYNDYAKKLGYAKEATLIQDLFLSGEKDKAAQIVPDKLVDETSLVGSKKHVAAQLESWQEACSKQKLGSLIFSAGSINELEFISKILLK